MKQLFKTFSLTLFLLGGSVFIFSLLNSCTDEDCQRCVGISAINVRAVDNADSTPHEPVNGEVVAKAFMLSLEMFDSASNRCALNFTNPIVPNAMAIRKVDCPIPITATNYIISSNENFDALHPANTNLNDLFYAPNGPSGKSSGIFNFYLLKEPDIEATHTFIVTIISSRQDTLIATANPIKLLK